MNYKMIFLTLLIWPVMAQEKLPDILSDGRITVREAVQSALQHNPDLKIAVAAHREAAAEVWASSGLVSPTLSFTREGIDRDNSAVFNEQRWGLSQPLPSPFSAFTRVRGARAQSAARGNEREQVRLNLMRDTKKAYATLSYALMQHSLAEERVQIARELLDAARARVEAGEASGLELMKTEVQLAAAENDLTDRQIRVDEARYRLFNQMGISPGEEGYHLEFPDTLHFFPVTFEEDAVLAGLRQMPRLLAAANRQNAARWDNRTAWSSALLPDLEVSLFRQDFGSGYDYYGFEAGVKIPLWFWLNDQGKIRASRAVLHRRNGELQQEERSLLEAAEGAWHRFKASKITLARYRDTIRDKSKTLFRLTAEGYRLGETDLLTLLDAQRLYLDSQDRYYQALYQYDVALIELEIFLGQEMIFTGE